MAQRITAVSFEADGIQVVTVLIDASSVSIERVLTLQPDELDPFLAHDTARSYLVAVNPPDALYETIQIPPVERKLEESLIRGEAARLHPELGAFVCAYSVIGDQPGDGRLMRKVACCLVPQETIQPILTPFITHNKTVQRLVAVPHILAQLVGSAAGYDQEPLLCGYDQGQSKTLFLVDNGSVVFARAVASNGYGWDPFDRQNLSMTQDYCFQALRIRAGRILVLNPDGHAEADDQPQPRLEWLPTPPLFAALDQETVLQCLASLVLATGPVSKEVDLLPSAYGCERSAQQLYRRGLQLCSGLALLLLLWLGLQWWSVIGLQQKVQQLRAGETTLHDTVRSYQQLQAAGSGLMPLLASWNEIMAGPDIPHALAAIDHLAVGSVRLNGLTVRRDKGTVQLSLAGQISGAGYGATQERFEQYQAAVRAIRGMQVTRGQLDPKAQQFTLEVTYKP